MIIRLAEGPLQTRFGSFNQILYCVKLGYSADVRSYVRAAEILRELMVQSITLMTYGILDKRRDLAVALFSVQHVVNQ